MPSIAQSADISRFVRDTLGCTCPPEVFEHIELESIADDTNPHTLQRIVLGERLLVYLACRTGPDGLASRVAALTVRGRRDRDDHGYNRFRLVVAGGYEGAIRELAASRFKEGSVCVKCWSIDNLLLIKQVRQATIFGKCRYRKNTNT